jgi:hypothetical protein
VLKPDGVLLANLILDGKLETPYARNLLATIESVFGRCAVEVLHKAKTLANVEVTCFASSRPAPSTSTATRRTGPTSTWRVRARRRQARCRAPRLDARLAAICG